jgi:uncharacterized membrane protein
MPNANRQRAIMAAQKVRLASDPRPTPEEPKLTAEQRKAMYAPKSALEMIPHRPAMPVRVAKTSLKATGWGLGIFTAILGGILVGESKQGFRS